MSCLWNLQQKDLGENFRQYRSTVWQCMTYSRNMLCITMTAKLYRENGSNIYLTQTETVEDGLQPTFLKQRFFSLLASHLWRICQFPVLLVVLGHIIRSQATTTCCRCCSTTTASTNFALHGQVLDILLHSSCPILLQMPWLPSIFRSLGKWNHGISRCCFLKCLTKKIRL